MAKSSDSSKGTKKARNNPGTKTVQPSGSFGKFIQSVIDRKGFSQNKVAKDGGIDSGNITNMVAGKKDNPEFKTIKKLAVGLEEPYLRVCASLLDKEEERPKEYWFDDRLMLCDDLLSQVPEIERIKVQALIEGLQNSLMKAYREQVGRAKKKLPEAVND